MTVHLGEGRDALSSRRRILGGKKVLKEKMNVEESERNKRGREGRGRKGHISVRLSICLSVCAARERGRLQKNGGETWGRNLSAESC